MYNGLPYDGDDGRAYAAAVTSLMHGQAAAGPVEVCAAVCSVAVWSWFHVGIQRRLDALTRFAGLLAGSNLKGSIEPVHPHPLSQLTRALIQVQLNLRGVVGDAREEVDGTAQSLAEIARGTHDLSSRTQAQASSLEHGCVDGAVRGHREADRRERTHGEPAERRHGNICI